MAESQFSPKSLAPVYAPGEFRRLCNEANRESWVLSREEYEQKLDELRPPLLEPASFKEPQPTRNEAR